MNLTNCSKMDGKEERVTRIALSEMAMGETRRFRLPNARAIDSGRVTATQMGNYMGCKFKTEADYANNMLAITRVPK